MTRVPFHPVTLTYYLQHILTLLHIMCYFSYTSYYSGLHILQFHRKTTTSTGSRISSMSMLLVLILKNYDHQMCRWCTILLVAEVQSIDKRLSWCYVSLSTETARNLLPHCSEGSSSSSHPIDSWTWKVDGDLRVANRWTYQSHRGRQREIAADPAKLFQVFFNTISMMKTRIKGFMREADVTKTLIDVKLYWKYDFEKRVNLWVLWASRISAAVFHSEEMIRAEWELLLFIHTYYICIHTPYTYL